jgi:hypothetical protein
VEEDWGAYFSGGQSAPQQQPEEDWDAYFGGAADSAVDFMKGYTRSIIGQGMGLGSGDEIEAGVRSFLPGQEGYNENLEKIRAEQAQFKNEHPVIGTGAEIVGGVVPAVLSRGRTAPATLGRAVGRGAAEGAAYGGTYGFGTGEGGFANRAVNAGISGLIGAAAGGAAAPVVTAAGWAGRQIAAPLINRARSILHPEAEAGRRVATALDIDRRGGQGISDQGMAYARQQSGQPVMNMDQGGEVTRRLARSSANQSPEAGSILQENIQERFQGQGERVNAFLRSRTGATGDVSGTHEGVQAAARRANRPAYRQAYQDGDRGIWTPELERLSGSPDVLAAMKSAVTTGKSRAINEGFGTFNPGVQISDTGVVTFARGAQGTPTYPNLQYWDYVKRELDDAANAARRAGRNEEASRLGEQARLLRDELDNNVPSYRGARQGAAAFFGAENALEAGQNFVNLNADSAAARRALAGFVPAERALFEEGFVSTLMDRVNRIPDGADVVRRIWGSPKSREQIEMVLGPQRAHEFEMFMTVEQMMDRARSALGNSTTARQLVELGLAGTAGAGAYGFTGDWQTGLLTLALVRGGRALNSGAMQRVDDSVARRIATMLVSDDPTVYRQGLQTVARSRRWSNNLRGYLTSLSGVTAGQQAGQ